MNTEQQPLSATLVMDPATQALIKANMTALSVAASWVIDDPDTADAVAGEANRAKSMVKVLDGKYKEFIVPAQMIIEAAKNLFKPAIDDLEAAVACYNGKLLGWRTQEQKRVAAENAAKEELARKLRAEAEARAKAELARAAEITRQKEELARREAEARQKAENEVRAAAAARQKAIDEGDKQAAQESARREAEARKEAQARAAAEAKATEQARSAEAEGAAKAQQLTLGAEAQATSQPAAEMREVVGTTFRSKWIAIQTVDDHEAKKAICAAASARPEMLAYLKLDLVAINRTATAQKQLFNVPGFKAEIQQSAAKAKGS